MIVTKPATNAAFSVDQYKISLFSILLLLSIGFGCSAKSFPGGNFTKQIIKKVPSKDPKTFVENGGNF
jgi:hypothetical protein